MFRIPKTVRQTGLNVGTVEAPTPAWVHLVATKPLIAWLVYRGVLESVEVGAARNFMSLFAATTTRAASLEELRWRYSREHRLEAARVIANHSAVSRLSGFFAFADKASIDRAVADPVWGFNDYFVQEVELQPGAHVSWHDSEWLETVRLDADGGLIAATQYALGEAFSSDPHWELLVSGRANIVGTDLRRRAYNVVKSEWPDSLAALEIARLAASVGNSTGYIAALPRLDNEAIVIEWFMKFPTDAAGESALIEALKGIPLSLRNQLDLRAIDEENWFKAPDLCSHSFEIPIDAWPWRLPAEQD